MENVLSMNSQILFSIDVPHNQKNMPNWFGKVRCPEVRSITSPASALLASSYQTNKGVGFPRPNQAGCLGNLIRYMLKLSRVTSSCCYSHRQLIVVEFRCFIEDFICWSIVFKARGPPYFW